MTVLPDAGSVKVQIVASPLLLEQLLREHIERDGRLQVVEDLTEADVLISTTSHGPIHVSRLAGTAALASPSQLVPSVLAAAAVPVAVRSIVLPEDQPAQASV